jgi:ADP-dependent NAD(P)H-hydrate dehydratase / NAD(P)H-hydrate epimerase
MKISTVEQMRELDRTAIEKYGIPDLMLMENAGLAVYEVIRREVGLAGRRFTVVCGGGNNGGDGFVAARKLFSEGAAVEVVFFGSPEKLKSSAKTNYDICRAVGVPVDTSRDFERCKKLFRDADAVVDGLFGTGLVRNIEGGYADLVRLINGSGKPVFSIDIPSGVGGDTGKVMGTAVQADFTVTFGLPKLGNILYPGASYCGELYVSHISFPPEHYFQDRIAQAVNTPVPLPERDPEGHKGSFGRTLFVAGASSYYGAPLLCARAFLKAGGGYSRLAAPASIIPTLAGHTPEIVFHPVKETGKGSIALENEKTILDIIRGSAGAKGADFLVIGPGLGTEEESAALVRKLLQSADLPLLIDGDGLRAVSGSRQALTKRKAPTVLTPHPGEMAGLLEITAKEVLGDPLAAVRRAAEEYQAITVLKGARSCIAEPGGKVWINVTGNAGMGTAGSGDVLSGTIPAMYGLGLPVPEAVRAGVLIHGSAGDIAADVHGEDGMTAETICDTLPAAVSKYRREYAVPGSFGYIKIV